ncbi:MAG: xanthine dehydrogenase family protein subunit M [Deltaproteobacteria bacterium]|nr:xanthine dehydrogenase family protein subunit M [Deltaproteobacteria bacterium]
MKPFEYLEPTTVSEACALLKKGGAEARVFAGGALMTILMKEGLLQPKTLINIKRISGLKGIDFHPQEGLTIGALVTHHELETSRTVKEKLPILCAVEKEVANIRVRSMATVGGNLASGEPLTDLPQVFIALDARIKIASSSGERVMPLEDLYVDYYQTRLAGDEIVTQVIVPPVPERTGIEYIRFSSSSVVDKPCVGVASRVSLGPQRSCQTVRIVLGCVGPTPLRAKKAEALVAGKRLNPQLAEEAGAVATGECSPVSDLRGSEQYKRAVVGVLVRRALAQAYESASRS